MELATGQILFPGKDSLDQLKVGDERSESQRKACS